MEVFDESKQLVLEAEMDDYYAWTLDRGSDLVKRALAVPIPGLITNSIFFCFIFVNNH